jgi:hypothetical protein
MSLGKVLGPWANGFITRTDEVGTLVVIVFK